jgi:hypothetical protein
LVVTWYTVDDTLSRNLFNTLSIFD